MSLSVPYLRSNTPRYRISMLRLLHNPDGSLIIGTHVHFDIDGYGAKWACGIPNQNILKPQSDDFASLFWSFQETCNITDKLKVELSLGV